MFGFQSLHFNDYYFCVLKGSDKLSRFDILKNSINITLLKDK